MPAKKTKKKCSPEYFVEILWGSEPEPGDAPKKYIFENAKELQAFCFGVGEAVGWSNASVVNIGQCNALSKGRVL